MNLLILYHLLNDLTDEKRRLDAAMLVTDDPARQGDLKQRIRQLAPLLADIRGGILEREMPGATSTLTPQEFEDHVHCALKAFESMGSLQHGELRQTA